MARMITVICGVNWPATAQVARLLSQAFAAAGRSAAVCDARTLEDIGRLVLRRPEDTLFVTIRWMTPDLLAALDGGAVRVVFVETPAAALFAHWSEHTQGDQAGALRETCRDLAPVTDLLARIPVLRFGPEMADDWAACRAFLAHFLPQDAVQALPEDAVVPPGPAAFRADTLPDADGAALLTGLDRAILSHGRATLPVPITMMLWGDFIPLAGPIDLTGSPRAAFFGPFLALPSGVWTVTATLLCQGVIQRPRVGMDAAHILPHGPEILGTCTFQLVPDGRMKVSYSFVNPAPNTPLEFRLLLQQAVFDGTVTLEALQVAPSDGAADA